MRFLKAFSPILLTRDLKTLLPVKKNSAPIASNPAIGRAAHMVTFLAMASSIGSPFSSVISLKL